MVDEQLIDFARKKIMRGAVYKKLLYALVERALKELDGQKAVMRLDLKYNNDRDYRARVDALTLFNTPLKFKISYQDISLNYYYAREFIAFLEILDVATEYDPYADADMVRSVNNQNPRDRRRALFRIDISQMAAILLPIWTELQHKHLRQQAEKKMLDEYNQYVAQRKSEGLPYISFEQFEEHREALEIEAAKKKRAELHREQ